ncbi:LamG-like jellyroll fold domain-containing protein [Aquabacterium sp.]|uniref:LamG-like jellyroll fold domain-containing protein n=1 Tax=Aquabacterium sp. TaxID=1872578 RepID=UPI002E34BDAF|nr:LamG-like jellyroll fold domain-containing protein [Aquabacterium sp.]HEX5311618.1 LamG-like jellyroll fold domain-containing protein [Aquabacterium sp.]
MASLNAFSPSFKVSALAGAGLLLAAMLSACGGGGGDKSSPASPTNYTGADSSGRVAYTWGFDNGANVAPGRTFLPTPGAEAVRTLTTCISTSPTCQVQEVPGKVGTALHFDPAAEQSYAWLAGGSSTAVCSGNVLQFNPFGYFNAAGRADSRMTVAMWVRADKIDTTSVYHLFGTQEPVYEGRDASFHVRLVDGKPTLSMYPDSGFGWEPDFVVQAPNAISAGEWHHIAVTYNDIHAMVYVDGLVVAQADRQQPDDKIKRSAINESCLPYFLGGITTYGFTSGTTNAVKSKTGLGYVFPGAIDELVFSNRTFDGNEILKLAGKAS